MSTEYTFVFETVQSRTVYFGNMTRNHLIGLFVVLLPAIASGVGIGIIMSANEEVRTLLQTPAVANGFLQCFLDQSRASFPISLQAHLHTVSDVINSFIMKSGLYPISETEALLFQTEIASSIVDIVVNEPSQQEDYAQTLATLIRIIKDCYAQSTGKPTTDLAIIIETFTKLFVDVIVNVEQSSSLKISAEEQKLLQTFEQVERYGFVNGEESINGPLELALQSELEAENKATQSAFQSNVQKPTVITTSIEKPISIDTIVNLPTLPIPSDLTPSLKQSPINNKNQNTGNIVSVNSNASGSTTIKSPTDVLQTIQTDVSSKVLPAPIANDNTNSALASTINQQSPATSGRAISVVQKSTINSPSNLAVINSQNTQSSITSENVQAVPRSNFPEPPPKDLSKSRVIRSISTSNKNNSVGQGKNINGIFSDFFKKEKPIKISDSMPKVIMSTIKRLIKSGNDKIITDIIQDAIVKENFFDPQFVSQIKEQASELLLNTITSLSMATTVPTFIGQIVTKILKPEYINDFVLDLYDSVEGVADLENSDDKLKSFVKVFIDGVVKFLTPFASQDILDSKRKKRDNVEIIYQDVNYPEPDTTSEVSAVSTISKTSFANSLEPASASTFPVSSSEATSSSSVTSPGTSVAESTAAGQATVNSINTFDVEPKPQSETILPDIDNKAPLLTFEDVSNTNEAIESPDNNLPSNTNPILVTTPNIVGGNKIQPTFTNSFSSALAEALANSGISSDVNNNDSKENNELIAETGITLNDSPININSQETENTINTDKTEVTPENDLSSSISSTSENTNESKQPPAIVIEFALVFSKAVAFSEALTTAVDLTLHGPTADNTIYEIMFTTLSEKGKSDPTIESRDSSHPIASNFDGMTPLVFTNALSAAVADTLLEEGLLTAEKIPTLTSSYIEILEETLDQLEVDDDPVQNSKALVIGTERFISSQGISVLHGATELAAHFKEDFIYAWEDIINNNDSLFPDDEEESFNAEKSKTLEEVPNLKCVSDPSNSTSFSGYLINELSNSNTLRRLLALPQMTKETAKEFYISFYSAALSQGIEIPQPDGDIFLKALSANLEAKSPDFFVTIYATSLEKFLCKRGVLKQQNSRALSRQYADILNRTSSVATIDGKQDGYFDQLITATFQFLVNLLIVKPLNPVSWTSNFLSELLSSSPVSFARLIRELAPAILSPAGLRHPDATKRIYDLTQSLANDVLAPGSDGINIPALAKRLEVIYKQIHTSNPALEPFGLRLGTNLEAICALVTFINAAEIPNVTPGDASEVIQEIIKVI